jgi:tetratricopeptide (TPR) repeat protein
MDTDRNLLFAVLALQADLIDRGQFIEACTLWSAHKDVPIENLLVERGWLTTAGKNLVEQLCHLKMSKHGGDAHASLVEVARPELFDALTTLADIPASPPASTRSGKTLAPGSRGKAGRYDLFEQLGRGGMGLILRGHDPELGRDVAVKLLREDRQDETDLKRRFVEEAQVSGQLQHPGVVPIYDLGCDENGLPYFAMKLVKGRTLADLLRDRPNPRHDVNRFLTIFEQVCQTLAYAHARGVIHRDLKPSNVMVGAFGEVQVMDWGLAKVLPNPRKEPSAAGGETVIHTARSDSTDQHSGPTGVLGTPGFMPPEQARGEIANVDERADVFGLGGLLCILLTDQPPYSDTDRHQVMKKAAAGDLSETFVRLDGSGADPELIALCKECLSPRREDRPRDARQVADRMGQYQAAVQERLHTAELERAAAEARAEEARTKVAVERRARRLTVGLAAALVLLVVGVGSSAWWIQQQRQTRAAEVARQRQQVEAEVGLAMNEARLLLDQAKAAPLDEMVKFREALAAAHRAEELARAGGASDEVRQQAALLTENITQEEESAQRDRELLVALLEVRAPQEGPRFRKNQQGFMTELTDVNIDDQFDQAFLDWDASFRVDELTTEEAAARLRGRPPAVIAEVIAALDEWASERRVQGRPRSDWQRLVDLAAALDDSASKRRELRELMLRGHLLHERVLGTLAVGLRPVPIPFDSWPGDDRNRLRQIVRETDAATEPVLGVLTLVRALRVAGDDGTAERLLRAAIRARPQEVTLHFALGKLLETQDPPRWGEAIECYTAARSLRRDLGDALANALLQAGRTDDGLLLYAQMVRDNPDNPWLHFRRGNALSMLNRHAEAEPEFRALIALKPDFADGYFNLGITLIHQNRPAEAEKAFRTTLGLRTEYPEALLMLGNTLLAQHQYEKAEMAYRRALKLRPRYAIGFINLGKALLSQNRLEDAEAAYRTAFELDPEDYQAAVNLSVVLSKQQRYPEAEDAARKALRLNRDGADAHYQLGLALYGQNRYREAEAEFRAALRLEPDSAREWSELGNALLRLSRYPEAETAYRMALGIKPHFPPAHVNLANVLSVQGRFVEAEESAREAVKLDDRLVEGHANLGIALREQGRFVEALKPFQRCEELLSKSPNAQASAANRTRQCQRLIALESKLPAILSGEIQPANTGECLEFAALCGRYKRLPVSAVRLYMIAFAADPKQADDLLAQHRYKAACSAVQGAAGEGTDTELLPDKVQAMLRRQALLWLRIDLAFYTQEAAGPVAAARAGVQRRLTRWLQEPGLRSIREREALDQLPENERRQWRRLWDDVAELLAKMEEGK